MLLRQVTRGERVEGAEEGGGSSPSNQLVTPPLCLSLCSVSLSGSLAAASAANSWQKISAVTAEKFFLREKFGP